MADDKVKVQLAHDYTDRDGKNHKADSVVSVDREESVRLLGEGRARTPDNDPDTAAPSDKTK